MPLQNFVNGSTPTIDAPWLNAVDTLLVTVFANAATPAQALSALGFSATGISIVTAATADDALTALGGTTVGKALFTAASAAAARTALGITTFGGTLIAAADAAAARVVLGITTFGSTLVTAADASAARTALGVTSPYDFIVACSDEGTPIVAGANVLSFRSARAFTLSSVKASLRTASDTGSVTVDVNLAGVSIFSTTITIEQGETTSLDATTQPVLSTTSIPADGLLTIDIDSDGNNAAGLKLYFLGVLP